MCIPQLRVICWVVMLALAWSPGSRAGAIGVHKCTDAAGKVSYQQQPCAAQQRADVVVVEGEIDPERKAEADAIAHANAVEREPEIAEVQQPLQTLPRQVTSKKEGEKPVPCPPTRENPPKIVRAKVEGSRFLPDGTIVYLSPRLPEFPSRTYLKGAGRWPKGCVEQ